MSELLLQTIVEKLEAFEIALVGQSRQNKDGEPTNEIVKSVQSFQSELAKFTAEFRSTHECVKNLSNQIRTLRVNYTHPKQSQVKHIHHFHKLVWITLCLFMVSLLLAYGWFNSHREKEVLEANSLKYRFWKANGNSSLLKIIYRTDSLYHLNKDRFRNEVLRSEHAITEQKEKSLAGGQKDK